MYKLLRFVDYYSVTHFIILNKIKFYSLNSKYSFFLSNCEPPNTNVHYVMLNRLVSLLK